MSRFAVNGHNVDSDDDTRLQLLLDTIYGRPKNRPQCLCTSGGVEMYVARSGDKYVLKRMPNSGAEHYPTCSSYDPPAELSGLGEVLGSAINIQPDDGSTRLALGFALTRSAGRAAPTASNNESMSAHTDGTKLTLRGLLHYLWDEAGFTRWSPAMAGKRNWHVIRRHVLHAAADKAAKGNPLADSLYVPEVFTLDHKNELAARRTASITRIAGPSKGRHKLMLVVAEVKDIAPSRFGHKIVFKHVPDCPFMVPDDLHRRLQKAFDIELALWEAIEHTHLMAIGTFAVTTSGIPTLEQLALMVVTDSWIPFESVFDKTLIDAFIAKGRPFRKSLRYNMIATKPLATVVALDTDPATACYVIGPGSDQVHMLELDQLIGRSALAQWTWNAGCGEAMPDLPSTAK